MLPAVFGVAVPSDFTSHLPPPLAPSNRFSMLEAIEFVKVCLTMSKDKSVRSSSKCPNVELERGAKKPAVTASARLHRTPPPTSPQELRVICVSL